MIPIINKPTRVTKTSATAINNIFINSFFNDSLETGIIKTDISDHFPIFVATKNFSLSNYPAKMTFLNRIINNESVEKFQTEQSTTNWNDVTTTQCPNKSYNLFINKFSQIYEKHFPQKTITKKTQNLISPWITKGLTKSSKQKQKLYIKFLKKRSKINESNYKNYKNLFEKIKNNLKKPHYSNLLLKHQSNVKKTWTIMKEIIGKSKLQSKNLPRRVIINGNDIYDECAIDNGFNKYFADMGPNLAKNIPLGTNSFASYLTKTQHCIQNTNLTFKELETAYFSVKKNKAPGYDDTSSTVILNCYNEIFNKSINTGIFPEALKIAQITPIFKTGDESLLTNYRPISVLPVFSKILERIMYNRIYNYLTKHQLLYNKQFGFQSNN